MSTFHLPSVLRNFLKCKCGEIIQNRVSGEEIRVQTTHGPVVGYRRESSTNYIYISFKGIPYAMPPVGPLRFKDPQPPIPWIDPPRKFCHGDSMCPQQVLIGMNVRGDEDCLHLNIYTREIESEQLAPVLVCIHGGFFSNGSASDDEYNPEYLLYHDIVFVAINYRLGAFGFSVLKDPELGVPGNAGLKDQCLALKWIKQNIKSFGGDPSNITLFGPGAGGVSTHLHCVSNMSDGLFHKAMMLSGNMHSEWAKHGVSDATVELAKYLGWNEMGGERDLLDFLQSCSSSSIARAQNEIISTYHKDQFIIAAFVPTVEPYISDQCFLHENPRILARNCWSKRIPVVHSYVSHEGHAFYNLLNMKGTMENAAPNYEFGNPYACTLGRRASLVVQKFYFGYTDPMDDENKWTRLTMVTDKYFLHGLHRDILLRDSDPNFGPTYICRFSYVPQKIQSRAPYQHAQVDGPVHNDDLKYFLKVPIEPIKSPTDHRDEITRARMIAIFVAFARNGDPNNEILQKSWEPMQSPAIDFNSGEPIYTVFDISDELKQIRLPEWERMLFWDCLYRNLDCPLY